MGSACELDYQILLSHDLGYLADPDSQRLGQNIVEIKWMLASFIQKVKC
jgi:four helix bundle protein